MRLMLLGLLPFWTVACSTAMTAPDFAIREVDWPYDRFTINQEYGLTQHADQYASGSHWGIDISKNDLAPIHPIANGTVVARGFYDCPNLPDPHCNAGQGNWILIDHPQLKTRSFYGHLAKKSKLKPQQNVTRSHVIGYEGRSGKIFNLDGTQADATSKTHLHLSIGDISVRRSQDGSLVPIIGVIQNPRDILPEVSKSGRSR